MFYLSSEDVRVNNLVEKIENTDVIITLDDVLNNDFLLRNAVDSEESLNYLLELANSDANVMSKLGKSEYASKKIITEKLSSIINSPNIESFNANRIVSPYMTSNNSGGAVASGNQSDWPAYYAFDRNNSTSWCHSNLGTITVSMNSPKYAYALNLYLNSNGGLNRLLNTFKGTIKLFLNNTQVYSSNSITLTLNSKYKINLPNALKFNKITFTQDTTISNSGTNWSGLTEIYVYGCNE